MNLMKWVKQNKKKFKLLILSMALLMCMSLFYSPITAYASENTHIAPPAVEAEIIGSLLRIRTSAGFYAVEAVYVNDKRFNHRVDSALVIDISQYITAGDAITVHAVDFAGNHSNTILLTPPVPALPPVPNNITPEGQGEVLDHLTGAEGIELITVNTPAGNTFYLVIDHTRSSNNVYFLNPVTEWDLLTLAAEAELTVPPYLIEMPQTEPIVIEREPPPETTEPSTPEPIKTEPTEDKSGGRSGLFIFLAIAGASAFGVVYYLKILKPKKEREMYSNDDNDEYEETDNFGDENEIYSEDSVGDDETDGESE